MRDNIDLNELKKKLKKNNHDENDKVAKHSKETAESKKEDDSPKEVTTSNDSTKKSNKLDETLDASLIENYRDSEKEPTSIHYDEKDVEDKTKNNTAKKNKKERLKFKKPDIHLPNINYWKVIFVIFLITFIVALMFYLFSSVSEVKEIEVNGNTNLETEEIIKRSGIQKGDKMYLLKTNSSEKDIDLLPIVESIQVNRKWPNKVVIDIEEYSVVGFIESDKSYYPVLENSRVLRGFHIPPANAPIIHFFEGREFEGIVKSLKEIEPNILKQISEIYYRPNDESYARIQIFMNNGQEIIGDYNTIGEKINYYQGMKHEIGDKKGVIDLEVSNTFIPYNSEEARLLKKDISRIPKHAPYIEEIDERLEQIRKSLDQLESS